MNDKVASYFGEDAVLLPCPSVLRRLEREAWTNVTERVTAFFDIDGTLGWTDPVAREQLSDDERKLSPVPSSAVADAIKRFVSAGNRAFICTGRSPLACRGCGATRRTS